MTKFYLILILFTRFIHFILWSENVKLFIPSSSNARERVYVYTGIWKNRRFFANVFDFFIINIRL